MSRPFFSDASPVPMDEFLKHPDYTERLEIHNFLTLKDCTVVRSKYTILIGPRAEGKSVIAKLFYFFNTLISFASCITDTLNSEAIELFTLIFPKISWDNQTFTIVYEVSSYRICLQNDHGLKLSANEVLLNDAKTVLEHQPTKKSIEEITDDTIDECVTFAYGYFSDIPYPLLRTQTFIDSNRQFLVLTEMRKEYMKNAEKIQNSDHFILSNCFGFEVALMRERYRNIYKKYGSKPRGKLLSESAVDENCVRKNGVLYVEGKTGCLVPVENSSSGQQELIPLFFILSSEAVGHTLLYVEEPETHLFPASQKKLISDLVEGVNKNGGSLFITTHSPYVLSTLNNHIQAAEASEMGQDKIDRMQKVLPKERWIPFDHVSCYFVENGTVRDIKDYENRIIDFSEIDKCSEDIVNQMNAILDVLYDREN